MFLAILPKDLLTISIVFFMISWRIFICFLASRFSCNFFRERFLIRPKSDEIKWAIISFCCWLLTDFISSLHFELSGVQFGLNVVSRGDWLGKPANIKVENNGAVVYVGSSLTVHNPLFFVNKLWPNRLMRCFYRSFSLSRYKKINWKPSSGRSQENEIL